MSNDIAVYDVDTPVFADDNLLEIAKQAEARIDAVIAIKKTALKVTNSNDWVDQNGKPYLQASGSEKIANLFNISWQINEPTIDQEEDGTITYTYKGRFSLRGRSIEVEGSRSSRDDFFKKYVWENGKKVGTEKTDGWYEKMAFKTVYRAAYSAITIDSQKIDDDYRRLSAAEDLASSRTFDDEYTEKANSTMLPSGDEPIDAEFSEESVDPETGEVIGGAGAGQPGPHPGDDKPPFQVG